MINIAFDFDEVLANFIPVLCGHILDETGVDISNKIRTFKIEVDGCSDEHVSKMIEDCVVNKTRNTLPCEYAIEAIEKFSDMYEGNAIVITSRDKNVSGDATYEWLDTHFPNVSFDVYFSYDKYNIARKLGLDYFVDDRHKTVQSLSPLLKAAFLIDKPWNINRDVKNNIYRARHLMDVYSKYLQMENSK